ncbi:MAG: glycoside hydrolase family 6 protein, partial [Microbacteriaceae bacterium]
DELAVITAQPSAVWIGDWYSDETLASVLRQELAAARTQARVPVFVTYAIPGRDCGQHSSGGLSEQRYRAWVGIVASTLRGSGAAVIVEPDALAMLGDCAGQGDRTALLRDAVAALADAGLAVYLDAGHSDWVPAERMAERLRAAGVDRARGFATNVSNFRATALETAYAERIRAALGGTAHYVIDTSRNGRGAQGEWCNPAGAALGDAPRAVAGGGGLDALLWIKSPGQSDGTCNGGPAAGQWWEAQALRLIRNR